MNKVEVGATYRHFKGHIVKVLAVAKDTESATGRAVVYEHLGTGVVWYRPYDMFTSEVDHDKYPEVLQKYRFEKVESATETEITKALMLLVQAVEQVTVNTAVEQGSLGVDEVFKILNEVRKLCMVEEV
jgi:hypothetical protein